MKARRQIGLRACSRKHWVRAATSTFRHDDQLRRQLLASAGFVVEEDLGPMGLNARYLARRRDGLQMAGGGFRDLSAVQRA